jgi:PAS domain S-box-containing protein
MTLDACYQSLIASAPDAVLLADAGGHCLDANALALELLGYRYDEVLGIGLSAVVGSWPPRIDRSWDAADVRRKDGTFVAVYMAATVLPDTRGNIVTYVMYLRPAIERTLDKEVLAAGLTATDQHTRQVLERITDGFCVLDRDWRFTYINEAAERIWGQARGELLGANVWEAFAPAIETPFYVACQQAMSDGITTSVEFYYAPLAGWFEVRVYPSLDGLSLFFREISESRQAEQELLASESKYRSLIEQLPAAVYLHAADESQTPIYFSPRHEELTGELTADAMARKSHWLENVHPEDRARVAEEDARSNAAGDQFRLEYRILRNERSDVWVLDESVPIRDDTGTIVAWQGVLLDVTERVHAEESQIRLAAIVASSSEAIMGTTLDGTITSWNPAAERLYGYSTAEAIGESVKMLVPPELSGDVATLLDRVRRGVRVEGYEAERLTRDGRRIDVSLSVAPVHDADGNIVGVSSVARDVTRLRRAERERDRLHAELEAEFQRAAEAQARLLPHAAPDVPGYEFAGACLPARQVGGDFFDWPSDHESVRVSLGDVMGKGMAASLLTATVRAALRAVTHLPVSAAVEAVNRALSPDLAQSDSFITLFHAALKPKSGQLTFVDAGHGLAFIHRHDGLVTLLRQRGLPLGIDAEARYPEGETMLERGDTLVICSDGLPDARPDLDLEPAGIAAWIDDRPDAQAKLDRLVALGTAVALRPDDLTLVLVRRREKGSSRPARSSKAENPSR